MGLGDLHKRSWTKRRSAQCRLAELLGVPRKWREFWFGYFSLKKPNILEVLRKLAIFFLSVLEMILCLTHDPAFLRDVKSKVL